MDKSMKKTQFAVGIIAAIVLALGAWAQRGAQAGAIILFVCGKLSIIEDKLSE